MTAAILRRVLDLLSYDPQTGVFSWRPRPVTDFKTKRAHSIWVVRFSGKPVASRSGKYGIVRIDGTCHYLHRLAWLVTFGEFPAGEIDHVNGDQSDNRIRNLRDASREINQQNIRRRPGPPSTLPLGAHFVARKKVRRFASKLRVNGRTKHLGYFDTAEEAHAAYVEAKRVAHAGCTL